MNIPTASLDRYRAAQAADHGPGHAEALRQIRSGAKTSHWIWYVLPQLTGLGRSATSRRYAIADLKEAQSYLADPVLGPRLAEITAAIAERLRAGQLMEDLMGGLDARKTVSSLTLFERAASQPASGGDGNRRPDGAGSLPSGRPWIPEFLDAATTALELATAQGLPRCAVTLARLRQTTSSPAEAS